MINQINCGVGKFNDLEGQSDEAVACKDCGVGKFNDLEGQSDEAVACKNFAVLANSTQGQSDQSLQRLYDLEANRTKQSACKDCSTGTFNNVVGAAAVPNTLINPPPYAARNPARTKPTISVLHVHNHNTARVVQHASVIVKAWLA